MSKTIIVDCLSTLGPGATNLVTAAAYAFLGGMPMLMITGQKPVLQSRQAQFQIIGLDDAPTHEIRETSHRCPQHPDSRENREFEPVISSQPPGAGPFAANTCIRSIGNGNTIVELRSPAISNSVAR